MDISCPIIIKLKICDFSQTSEYENKLNCRTTRLTRLFYHNKNNKINGSIKNGKCEKNKQTAKCSSIGRSGNEDDFRGKRVVVVPNGYPYVFKCSNGNLHCCKVNSESVCYP